jgi:hypothetical protein
VHGYYRVYDEFENGLYTFAARRRPTDLSIITSTNVAQFLRLCEYRTETGEWPKIGVDRTRSGEVFPACRIEGLGLNFEHPVMENGVERQGTPEDRVLPIYVTHAEESFIEAAREVLQGIPIWPSNDVFDPLKYSPPVLPGEERLSIQDLSTIEEVNDNLLLILASLDDEIMMPSIRAVRKLMNGLRKLESGASSSEKVALFQKCIERLNKFEDNGPGVDTSDRETLLDLLYRIGEIFSLRSKSKYLDQWRTF